METATAPLQTEKDCATALPRSFPPRFDLNGIPGFYFRDGSWRLCAYSGLLIPVRDADGRMQGIQIRRDSADRMKYVWLSGAAGLAAHLREVGFM